jgi:AcrR family transcriptional regulator
VPKIKAANIVEHAAQQQAAVFEAAVRLFLERGYDQVSMGDIAGEVGLARNSLYRYFPDKAHMLAQWARSQMPAREHQTAELLSAPGTPRERLHAWALSQMDFALRPEHAMIVALGKVSAGLNPKLRAEIGDYHRRMGQPLYQVLAEAGVEDAGTQRVVADLINGLVLAGAQLEARGQSDLVRQRVLLGVDGLLGS